MRAKGKKLLLALLLICGIMAAFVGCAPEDATNEEEPVTYKITYVLNGGEGDALGAFEEGLGGYPSLLLAKGLLDGMISVAMAASLGAGVLFSCVSVFVYQAALTLAAGWMQPFMSEAAITEMSATGGLMLMAIGVNLLGLMKIRIMNMLPGLVFAVVLVKLFL